MGFKNPDVPAVNPETFLDEPISDRVRQLAAHWGEYGFGAAKMVHTIYVMKVFVLYFIGGLAIATWTSGVGPVWDVAGWWNEPIVYQKLLLWTCMLEAIGIAGSWGPLAGKFTPMTGGIRFWTKPGTLRMRPWKAVPLTGGDTRTVLDVVLYVALLATLATAVVLPGRASESLAAAVPESTGKLVMPGLVGAIVVLLVLVGLRDKVIFLAARAEQYLPAMVFFTVLGFTDMIVALKLLIVVVWVGAGVSKFGLHFSNVVAPMMSNSPSLPSRWLKRAHYRDFPHDLRPSKLAVFMAHVGGTMVEIVTPLVLLFSTNQTVTLLAVAMMVIFHLFITSSFPLAVPLEWNVFFAFATIFLFAGFPAGDGFAVTDMSSTALLMGIVAALLFFPILGNLRPDLVSFLPSMRQYAGNWASGMWAFKPGAEAKLNKVVRPTTNQIDQLQTMGYDPVSAEITMQLTITWRAMHSQGRGLFSLLHDRLPDIDNWTIREAEFACNSLLGFNFGDGHFHNEDMIAALQRHCGFEPGEFVVVWVESSAIGSKIQRYKVIDAAIGVVERGSWNIADAVAEQPWLPNGPIPLFPTWAHPEWTLTPAGAVARDAAADDAPDDPMGDKVGS